MKSRSLKSLDKKNKENSAVVFFDSLYTKKSSDWKKIGEKKLLATCKEAYTKVPAYKKFLDDTKINIKKIKSITDFESVPIVGKKNYLCANAWEDLCKNKSLSSESLVMTSTSGSTGDPFYFPRTTTIDMQSSFSHEIFLRSSKIAKNKSTLVIDCFGMGVWIGGLITYQAFKYIADRGYAITIITPGISKREIFQALKNLSRKYDQIILCGYPPFIKDVVDDAPEYGIVWSDYSLKIIFAAEGFSETFRDYIVQKTGIKNLYRDTMNIYGSADLGTMAEESPLCILLRRIALTHEKLYMRLFGQATRLPTLAQYIPEFINFEQKAGSIYPTGDNVLPLVRYEIGDIGGVMTYDDVMKICSEEGIDIVNEIKLIGIQDTITELPFVYVYERSDFSATFYGALIYPEFIKKALAVEVLKEELTGKFTMYTKNDEQENQYLEISIELKSGQKETKKLRTQVLSTVHDTLLSQSAEYKKIAESLEEKAYPKILFWPQGHETYFMSGAKQKWVKR